jgi:hypothetical protein
MATGESRVIGPDDIDRAVRSVAEIFGADQVVIIGSQGLLVGRDDVDKRLRMSVEVDAYPQNACDWERLHPGQEASELINGMLGEGSHFHAAHGFFVDGVDDRTATLPPGWQERGVPRSCS